MSEINKRITVSDTITWRKVKDEAVILNLETSDYYSLNPEGTFIWELLTKNKSAGKIALALAEEYSISPEEAATDTADFIKKLSKIGLITATEAA